VKKKVKIILCNEEIFKKDFLPLIIDLWCGNKYIPSNRQHKNWLNQKIHASFIDFGVALCAYTMENEPIGYIFYKHDTGIEGVSFSYENANIIQIGLFKKFRNQGIGTKLLEKACEKIKDNKGKYLYTDTNSDNNINIFIFYIKRGFIPMGENGINGNGQIYFYKNL